MIYFHFNFFCTKIDTQEEQNDQGKNEMQVVTIMYTGEKIKVPYLIADLLKY